MTINVGWVYLAINPENPDVVYAAISNSESRGVYKTINGGQHWEQMNNGIENLEGHDYIQTIAINPKFPETLYLGVTSSNSNDQNPLLYESNDGANSWHSFSVGMPEYGTVQTLSVDTMNSRMYAGTRNGIYTLDFELSVDENHLQMPKSISLKQNYPNPFNSSTKIAYILSEKSFVNLTVFDLSGRVVTELMNQNITAGTHKAIWNGKDQNGIPVSSGVYLYTLTAKSRETGKIFTQFNKMVFLK